jgi:hypothetical protein
VVDRSLPGLFTKDKKNALVPVALERLIRVHLPPMYTWGLRGNQVDSFFVLDFKLSFEVLDFR